MKTTPRMKSFTIDEFTEGCQAGAGAFRLRAEAVRRRPHPLQPRDPCPPAPGRPRARRRPLPPMRGHRKLACRPCSARLPRRPHRAGQPPDPLRPLQPAQRQPRGWRVMPGDNVRASGGASPAQGKSGRMPLPQTLATDKAARGRFHGDRPRKPFLHTPQRNPDPPTPCQSPTSPPRA